MRIVLLLLVVACGSKDTPAPRETPRTGSADTRPVDPVVQLASGSTAVCATRASGHAYCWGIDDLRPYAKPVHEVAHDAVAAVPGSARPCIERNDGPRCMTAPGLEHVDRVVSGALGGCAIAAGQISCWGEPKQPAGPSLTIEKPIDLHLRLSPSGACALEASGAVVCWGELDDMTRRMFPPTRTHVLGDVAALAPMGRESLCVLRKAGDIACWSAAALIDALDGKPSEPTIVAAVPGDPWKLVVENCALRTSGRVFCWGDDSLGQVTGVGNRRERAAPLVEPSHVRLLGSFDEDPWCAVVADGSVVCWPTGSGRPALRLPAPATSDDEVVQVEQTINGACALQRRGRVMCFGHEDSSRYPAMPVALAGLDDAVAIASAGGRLCAVRKGGAVVCGFSEQPPLAPVRGIDDAIAVAVSSKFACALRRAGGVRCWDDTRSIVPPGLPPLEKLVVARDTGIYVCGIDREHAAWCWGAADCTAQACRVPGVANVSELAAGPTESARPIFHAITTDGHVVTWGEYDKHTVTRRDDIVNARTIRAGRYASCVQDAAGAVSCWGEVREHLNDGHRSVVTEPLEVVFP